MLKTVLVNKLLSPDDYQVPMIEVRRLVKHIDVSKLWLGRLLSRSPRQILRAVDGISFSIEHGKTFGLVGESGCGKTTVARLIVDLDQPTSGKIFFEGVDIANIRGRKEMAKMRRRWQMIFQDPYSSLNPRWRVRDIIAEPIRAFGLATSRHAVRDRVAELLVQVGLSPSDGAKYPHEFSGGQRQRISVARALSSYPQCIVCDEPTSALDVSVQAQILNLMKDLQCRFGLTYLFISHDLAVVQHLSDTIGVMYLGRLCEVAPARDLFSNPQHPYTRLLLDTVPDLRMRGTAREPVGGEVPNPIEPPSGCGFHPRCPYVNERCRQERPEPIGSKSVLVACHGVEEGRV